MELTLTPAWSIELASDAAPARLAATELQRTLRRMGGPALPIVEAASGPRIALRHGESGDGFVRAPDAGGLLLRGDGPRGLLYGVYSLLEAMGCYWIGPGAERLPRRSRLSLPAEALADRPALAGRGLVIGHDHFLDQAEAWVDWAARARLNTIFIHTISQGLALGACHLERWRSRRAAILPLIRQRGLRLELGGHHLRDMLPRALFRSRPELFRHDGARRNPDHNCCPSNPETLDLLRERATAFFQSFPEAEVYHLWPDDVSGGCWCRCPRCAGLSPADQALTAANALADALARLRPEARLAYLAYHDTEEPPARVSPRPNVDLLYAPRPRSYAHSLGAAANPINTAYAARLQANMAHFGPGAGPRTAAFEYYLDGILFKSALPPLPEVIAADMRHYRAAGVGAVHTLLTGDRPWLVAPLNAGLFARLAWDPEADLGALLDAELTARAPRSPQALGAAYSALGTAWRAALDLDPAELAMRAEPLRARDVVADPPADMLDFMAAPKPYSERRLERLRAAADQIAAGRAAWEIVRAAAFADAPALEAERAEWEAGALLIEFLAARQALYVLAGRHAPRPRLREAQAAAQAALDALLAWATDHVPPRARPGHTLLRSIFQLHLDAVYDRKLAPLWGRATLRAHRAAALAAQLFGASR